MLFRVKKLARELVVLLEAAAVAAAVADRPVLTPSAVAAAEADRPVLLTPPAGESKPDANKSCKPNTLPSLPVKNSFHDLSNRALLAGGCPASFAMVRVRFYA